MSRDGFPAIRVVAALAAVFSLLAVAAGAPAPKPVGDFENHADVGTVTRPGSAEYDAEKKEYRITGGGENIWGKVDAFHFAFSKTSGDLTLSADVRFVGEGKNAHRKACLMVRQSPDAGAPYADVAVHGDGLVSLQFRRQKGGVTEEVKAKAPVKGTVSVRLRREGNQFTLWVAEAGKPLEQAGAAAVPLADPVYAGLAVSAHDPAVTETAAFSAVTLRR